MAETLSFDLSLSHAGFNLQGAADIPLHGITGIAGNSGSGKTTLLRALAGLEPNTKGTVRFGDSDWTMLSPQDRPIGFVFQDMRLFRHLSVAENIAYGAKRRNVSKSAVDEIIQAFDLSPLLNRRPTSLSGGEARRVAIGRAMAAGPRILFLDEPMVGLDTNRRAEVLPYITRAVDHFGLSVLYVSHSMFEMNLLADRILPIDGGKIGNLQAGPPRIELPATASEDGQISFEVDGHILHLSGQGTFGDICELRPGSGSILCETHPGKNTSAAVLPVIVEDTVAGLVSVAGQTISVADTDEFHQGQAAWLICPQLRARFRARAK